MFRAGGLRRGRLKTDGPPRSLGRFFSLAVARERALSFSIRVRIAYLVSLYLAAPARRLRARSALRPSRPGFL